MNSPSDFTASPNAQENIQKTVIVGMSGGVDSSVAGLLLKQQGYRVIGLFMKNWEETDEHGVCQASKEFEDVVRVCEKLDIPYYSVDFVKEYRDQVFADFLKEYRAGYTPNPDVLCNREIKFKVFYDRAMAMGADYLATGHYCQIATQSDPKVPGKSVFSLKKAHDLDKDQSYFLAAIDGQVLERVLFPIGHLPKKEVRRLALEHGLATAQKKDSTGICFIGERNFQPFLSQYLSATPGPMVTPRGEVVGQHLGVVYYTLGQRKGLGLGGQGEPWFVLKKDLAHNTLVVDRGEEHPGLYSRELWSERGSWIAPGFSPEFPLRAQAKVRYRQPDQACTITRQGDRLHVVFDEPQRAVTPGQYAVFYEGDECLGGAVIREVGPTLDFSAQNEKLRL